MGILFFMGITLLDWSRWAPVVHLPMHTYIRSWLMQRCPFSLPPLVNHKLIHSMCVHALLLCFGKWQPSPSSIAAKNAAFHFALTANITPHFLIGEVINSEGYQESRNGDCAIDFV